jgi:hypothetical protein
MNPAGADVAITDTVPPTLVTQLAPNRATAGQATTTAAPGGPSAPCGDNGEPAVHRAATSAYRLITRRRLDLAAVLAGRKRSALALAGMTVGYAAVSVTSLLFVSGLIGFATGNGG